MGESTKENAEIGFAAGDLAREAWRAITSLARRPSSISLAATADATLCASASVVRRRPVIAVREDCEALLADLPRGRSRLKVTLPRHLFLAKEVVLPSTDRRELEGMVSFEIPSLFPVDGSLLTWGWYAVGVTAEGYTRLRAVAIETAVLDSHLEELDPAVRLRTDAEPSTVSLANYFLAANESWPLEPVAIAAVWDGGIDFVVLSKNGIEFDRGLRTSAAPSGVETAAMSIATSLEMYAEASGRPGVSRLYLFCPEPQRDALKTAVEQATGTAAEQPPVLACLEGNRQTTVHEAIAVGAAVAPLVEGSVEVQLTPPRLVALKNSVNRFRRTFITTLLVFLSLAFSFGALALRARRTAGFVKVLEEHVASIAPEAGQIDAKRQRLAAIKRQLAGRSRLLEILQELYRVTPADIFLTSLELDDKGLLTLQGHAQEMYRPTEYAQMLERSDVFGKSAQQGVSSQQRTEGGKTYIEFTIVRDLAEER